MIRFVTIPVVFILLLLTLIIFSPLHFAGDLGLCLASPNQWHLPKFFGWLINSGLIFLSSIIIGNANKKYNFIQEIEPVMPMAFLLIMSCNCITTATLTTSTLLLFINVLSLYVILSTYEEYNASRQFFVLGTLPAFGSMIQYSFLLMIPVYVGGGLLMKSFRLRELIAFIFGLVAPYWIVMGLGWVSFSSFRMPEAMTIFNTSSVDNDIFLSLVALLAMAVVALIIALYNSMRLYTRNSRLRCMHLSINLMGFVAALAVIFDFNNFPAYWGTIALWFSIELATLLALYDIRHPRYTLGIILIIFLPLYILTI